MGAVTGGLTVGLVTGGLTVGLVTGGLTVGLVTGGLGVGFTGIYQSGYCCLIWISEIQTILLN